MAPFSRALIVESPHPTLDAHLRAIGITPTRLDAVPDEDALISAINRVGAQVLFKRSRVQVTRRLIESCRSLHAVQLCCIGDDSVDKEACADHGVMVFNDPFSNARSVVELAIGHMISLSRRLVETEVQMRSNDWQKTAAGRYEIAGKQLGIVGLGNIGRQVARAAQAMGMTVSFFDNRPVAEEVGLEMGWQRHNTLQALFRGSDVVTVHTSAVDTHGRENAGLLDVVLGQLGADQVPNSPRIFLNLARGNVHSTGALLDAVQSGAVRYAAVDVYPEEPRPGQSNWRNPYASEDRVVCTPHIGAATQEAQPRIAQRVADTIGAFSRQGSMRDCVFAARATVSGGGLEEGQCILAVVHSTKRGTKKAIDDAIYEAGASNLVSSHRDFSRGIAYDLAVMDRALSEDELTQLVQRAKDLAGEADAVRTIRQICLPVGGWV